MFYRGYKIIQAKNYHVSVYLLGTRERVFHCQCGKELDGKELMEMVEFYEKMVKGLEYGREVDNGR